MTDYETLRQEALKALGYHSSSSAIPLKEAIDTLACVPQYTSVLSRLAIKMAELIQSQHFHPLVAVTPDRKQLLRFEVSIPVGTVGPIKIDLL